MVRYNPRLERSLKRRSNYRDIKQSFLIICEGVNTEPDYFNAFRLTSASVKALGKGLNTIKLVQEAIIIKNEEKRKGHSFDQYWVVFDKDDFPNNDFNEAIRLAESNGFHWQKRVAHIQEHLWLIDGHFWQKNIAVHVSFFWFIEKHYWLKTIHSISSASPTPKGVLFMVISFPIA